MSSTFITSKTFKNIRDLLAKNQVYKRMGIPKEQKIILLNRPFCLSLWTDLRGAFCGFCFLFAESYQRFKKCHHFPVLFTQKVFCSWKKKPQKCHCFCQPLLILALYIRLSNENGLNALSLERRLVTPDVMIQEGKSLLWNTLHSYFSCILQVRNSEVWNKKTLLVYNLTT